MLYLACYLVCLLVNPHYKEFSGHSFCISLQIRKSSVEEGTLGNHTIEPSYSPCGSSHLSQVFQGLLSNLSLFHCLSCPTTSSLLSYDTSCGSLTPFSSRMCETWQRLWSQTDLNLNLVLLPSTVWTWANVNVSQSGELVPLVNPWFLIPLVNFSVFLLVMLTLSFCLKVVPIRIHDGTCVYFLTTETLHSLLSVK